MCTYTYICLNIYTRFTKLLRALAVHLIRGLWKSVFIRLLDIDSEPHSRLIAPREYFMTSEVTHADTTPLSTSPPTTGANDLNFLHLLLIWFEGHSTHSHIRDTDVTNVLKCSSFILRVYAPWERTGCIQRKDRRGAYSRATRVAR